MGWYKVPSLVKAGFMVRSQETVVVSTDNLSPSYFSSLIDENGTDYFVSVPEFGAVRNISGRLLKSLEGSVSYHLANANASERVITFFSERSLDNGVTWIPNDFSAREESVRGVAAKYSTKSSEAFDLEVGALLRFGFFVDAVGVSLLPVAISAKGNAIDGPSFRWKLNEV